MHIVGPFAVNFLCKTMHCMLRMQYVIILLNRLFVANYSSLETIPLVPGNKTVFYAPHVRPKAVFIQNMIFLAPARGSMRLASPRPQNIPPSQISQTPAYKGISDSL